MFTEKEKLQEVIRVGNLMAEVRDVDYLMEKILTEARRFVHADAGSIYRKDGDRLYFKYSQNDTIQNRLPKGKRLVYTTFDMPVNENTIAGYVALTGEMLNIEDVYNLSLDVPYKFGKKFDTISGYKTTSMLTTPLKSMRGDVLGVLQVINARDENGGVTPFREEDLPLIRLFASNAAVAMERAQMTRTIVLRMVRMAELRDPKETGAHVQRVGSVSAELYAAWARRKDVAEEEMNRNRDALKIAAMLHDVGKVAVSDTILKKPGRLEPHEFEIMKEHTYYGARLFVNPHSEVDEMAAEIALNHHERWDGGGYPGHIDPFTLKPLPGLQDSRGKAAGKKGEEIPFWARIVSVADVFDALSCRRCYKEPWSRDDVFREMEKQGGKQFDPELIHIFFSISDVAEAILHEYPDEQE